MEQMPKKKTPKISIKCEHTELIDPKKLKEHPGNPNKHPSKQIEMLAKSIEAYGWRHPIVVSKRSGYIVAGHGRKAAALGLGCQVPVDYQDFASEEEELAVLLADNILPELAVMDEELLLLGKGKLELLEFDLETIGIPELKVDDNKSESLDYNPEFKIVVICTSEDNQAITLEKLEEMGLQCQPLIL
jgi:hypothetical protein